MDNASAYAVAAAAQRRPALELVGGALDLHELVRLATLAASSHNTQPWLFRLRTQAIEVLPDFRRRCPAVDPDDAHLWRSLGCAAENLVHAAAAQGHAASVQLAQQPQGLRVDFEPSAALGATDLSAALVRRQCTRRPFDGRAIAREHRALLAQAGACGTARTLLLDSPALRDTVIDFVRAGDVTQLTDPAFRRELIRWLRFTDAEALETGDGLASTPAGQPSLPRWLARPLLRFLLTGRGQAETDTANIRSSPLLAVVVASADSPGAWVDAGRAYERLALQATALGIRTAFINQPIEVPSLRASLHGALGLHGETAQLLLRLGHGPEAPFSLRRPLEDVLLDQRGPEDPVSQTVSAPTPPA
ncbi:nitroreductase [uncultured Thiohalocapsa sp.]|uniref:Acg family FMN-binding oxidoreductase n=1 Tax=uncultured Thiohalocapsa sp. TaxID=768990 RepID=UPI0025FF8B90|nr:nitroreductase [uncultured Thiohalocapsa sp.]